MSKQTLTEYVSRQRKRFAGVEGKIVRSIEVIGDRRADNTPWFCIRFTDDTQLTMEVFEGPRIPVVKAQWARKNGNSLFHLRRKIFEQKQDAAPKGGK